MISVVKKLLEHFMKKKKKNTKNKSTKIRIEKVIKGKRNILYARWKGYDNSFNIWTDKKDLID